jgi:hypothetical protein
MYSQILKPLNQTNTKSVVFICKEIQSRYFYFTRHDLRWIVLSFGVYLDPLTFPSSSEDLFDHATKINMICNLLKDNN